VKPEGVTLWACVKAARAAATKDVVKYMVCMVSVLKLQERWRISTVVICDVPEALSSMA
jgi:hypothetical protein